MRSEGWEIIRNSTDKSVEKDISLLTNAIKIFDIILALTAGGPGGSTYSATLDVYREAFQNNNFGLGSAKALILFVTVMLLTNVVLKLLQSREVEL